MSAFVVAAVAMLVSLVPIGIAAARGPAMEAVVAYEAASSILVMVLILLPQAFTRSGLFEFPVLMAVLLLGGGLVYLRAVERWL
ncbi:MAG TPA: hypothetical protein VKR78_05500 [Acidimicrobiales bacterium]|jgi:hypothetical protein|nr:hypothetical protein [Acidimicrobiales bacterium]